MANKLEGAANYLPFIECTRDAAKQNEEPQNRPPKQQEEAYLFRITYILKIKTNLQR